MKISSLILARFFQYGMLVVFTLLVLFYFLTVPALFLAVIWALAAALVSLFGIQSVISGLIALLFVAGLSYLILQNPESYRATADAGAELIKIALVQNREFEQLVLSIKGDSVNPVDVSELREQPAHILALGLFKSLRVKLFAARRGT